MEDADRVPTYVAFFGERVMDERGRLRHLAKAVHAPSNAQVYVRAGL